MRIALESQLHDSLSRMEKCRSSNLKDSNSAIVNKACSVFCKINKLQHEQVAVWLYARAERIFA